MLQFTGVIARLDDLEHKIYFEPGSMVTEYSRLPHEGPEWLSPASTDYVYLGQSAGVYFVTEVIPAVEALGAGPEPGEPAEHGSGFFARLLTPDLAIGVDGSQTIVLVVTEPRGKMLRVVAVTDVDAFKAALDDARTAQRIALEEADTARLRGVDEARRARGQLTQSEAVEWLTGEDEEKLSRSAAVVLVDGVRRGRAASVALAGMTYDGTYWIVPR
jgi:hypothetical protein